MSRKNTAEEILRDTVEQLTHQLSLLQRSQARQRKGVVVCLFVMLATVALGAAVKVRGGEFEIWPDAATADPKSSHQLELIGTTGAGAQRSIVLQNKSIDATSHRLDIRAGATDLLTLKSDGKLGVGTTTPGAKLEVAGQVVITGGTPAAGQVLTSDATGEATWEPEGGLSTTSNSNTLDADRDANETASKLYFEVDGAKRLTIDGGADDWGDLSTAAFVRVFSVSAQDVDPRGLFFKPDGTRLYNVGWVNNEVNEYSLSTAWNISTASFVRVFRVAADRNTHG